MAKTPGMCHSVISVIRFMKQTKTQTTIERLAKEWACDPRTVARWKRSRAPLHDSKAMRTWLSTRKNLPPGTAALLAGMRTQSAATPATPTAALRTGSGATLARLEQSEADASGAYQKALASGDAVSIKAARANWLDVCEALRRFDAQVESNRREDGDMLPRVEIERLLHATAAAWSSGLYSVADRTQQLCRDGRLMEFPAGKVVECLWGAFAGALASALVNHKAPRWFVPAITSGTVFLDAEKRVDEVAEAFKAFVAVGLDKNLPLT